MSGCLECAGERARTAAAVDAARREERETIVAFVQERVNLYPDEDDPRAKIAQRITWDIVEWIRARTPASEAQDSGESPSASGPEEEWLPPETRMCRVCSGEPLAPWPPEHGKGPTHHTCYPGYERATLIAQRDAAARLRAREEAVGRLVEAAEAVGPRASVKAWADLTAALDALKTAQEQSTNDDLNADVVAGMRDDEVSPEEFAAILERSRHPSPPTPALVEAFAKYAPPRDGECEDVSDEVTTLRATLANVEADRLRYQQERDHYRKEVGTLRRERDECYEALDKCMRERDALRDRITTICDEAIGLQPVQSADESLTLIEQHMATLRRDPSEAVTSLHALCDEVRTRLESAEAQGRWPVGCGLSQALAMLRREREDRHG